MNKSTALRAGMAILILVARLVSPIPLPGLFIVLVPAVIGLIFAGIIKQEA